MSEQRTNLTRQFGIPSAFAIKERTSVVRLQAGGGFKNAIDLFPTGLIHAGSVPAHDGAKPWRCSSRELP